MSTNSISNNLRLNKNINEDTFEETSSKETTLLKDELSEYNKLKHVLQQKKDKMYNIQSTLYNLKREIRKDTERLENLCNHNYKRECTTEGCYTEYHYICINCGKFR